MFPAPEIAAVEAPSGAPAERAVTGDGASVALVYGGEQEGRVGACGCDAYPKGGFARVAAMTEAIRAADPSIPVLLLNPGGWLTSDHAAGVLVPRSVADNAFVHRALAQVRYDALNVTWRSRTRTSWWSSPTTCRDRCRPSPPSPGWTW